MALSRWSPGCDLYIFECDYTREDGTTVGALTCCGCLFDGGSFFGNPDEMMEHVREHKRAGHAVPDYLFRELDGYVLMHDFTPGNGEDEYSDVCTVCGEHESEHE